MKILVASDKFKGSLSAREACAAIAAGLRAHRGELETREIPVADGGEGMAAALTSARGGRWIETTVEDALGRPVKAGFGLFNEGKSAAIEMAEASGLWRIAEPERNPWVASTRGTGQLLAEAMQRGLEEILLGIGGSATNDGGSGMAEALGFRFLDAAGHPLPVPERLGDVAKILPPAPERKFPRVVTACDVTNPVLGENGCTRVYGPQKGIYPVDFAAHEARLARLVSLVENGAAFAASPGSGAAGGLGFGCLVFLGAELKPGFDLVADVLELKKAVAWADLIVTGEGKIDGQSLQGKAPGGVARLAREAGKPVAAFCGVKAEDENLDGVFDCIIEIERGALPPGEAIKRAGELLRRTAEKRAGEILRRVN